MTAYQFPLNFQTTSSTQKLLEFNQSGKLSISKIIVTYPTGVAYTAQLKLSDNGVSTTLWSFTLSDGDGVRDTDGYDLTTGCELIIIGTVGLNVTIFG